MPGLVLNTFCESSRSLTNQDTHDMCKYHSKGQATMLLDLLGVELKIWKENSGISSRFGKRNCS